MPTTLPKLHRINDDAAALGVSRKTIYSMVHRGALTLVKIGPNASRITDESIKALIERNTAHVAK